MTEVTGFTAARSQAIENAAVTGASVVGDNLVMTRHDGSTFLAGNVRGATGATGAGGSTGPAGSPGYLSVADDAARIALSPIEGQPVYVRNTDRFWVWNGASWDLIAGRIPHVKLVRTTPSAALAAGFTTIPWSSALRDNFGGADLANNRILIPAGFPTGLWLLHAQVDVTSGSATALKSSIIGSSLAPGGRLATCDCNGYLNGVIPVGGKPIRLVAGQDVFLQLYSGSGTNVADGAAGEDTTSLSATWLGPTA